MFSWRRKAPRERRSKKKIANIDLKVPDVEWQTTGRNVRPPASNENPAKRRSLLVLCTALNFQPRHIAMLDFKIWF